jgi:CxxC-x17-CxxC domain-containing protein
MYEIHSKWFSRCGEENSVYNILNRTWFRPRDIVRYISATKNTLHSNSDTYTKAVFDESIEEYSRECLKEIREELNTMFKPDEIDNIVSLLSGFKTQFCLSDLFVRAETYFFGLFSENQIVTVVNDLYRVGVLGNVSIKTKNERWLHTGFDTLVYGEEWLILVHRALWKALSISPYSTSQNPPPLKTSQTTSFYEDKILVCKECDNEFIFAAGEQEFYEERGFMATPKRCKNCRDARKNASRIPRDFYAVCCASCGAEAKVPFAPKTDRPIYCSDCFARMRENG